jgi:hypothetical protein
VVFRLFTGSIRVSVLNQLKSRRRALFLVLLAAPRVATPITHFISFEVGDLIDGL